MSDPHDNYKEIDCNNDNLNSSGLIQKLLRTGIYLQRQGNRMVGPYGIKQQQFTVLNEIVRRGPVNQTQLVGELLFEKSNLSKIVHLLIKKGLIQSEPSFQDRRITILNYTFKGLKVWQKSMKRIQKWSLLFTSALSQKDIEQLGRLMDKLTMTEIDPFVIGNVIEKNGKKEWMQK